MLNASEWFLLASLAAFSLWLLLALAWFFSARRRERRTVQRIRGLW